MWSASHSMQNKAFRKTENSQAQKGNILECRMIHVGKLSQPGTTNQKDNQSKSSLFFLETVSKPTHNILSWYGACMLMSYKNIEFVEKWTFNFRTPLLSSWTSVIVLKGLVPGIIRNGTSKVERCEIWWNMKISCSYLLWNYDQQ